MRHHIEGACFFLGFDRGKSLQTPHYVAALVFAGYKSRQEDKKEGFMPQNKIHFTLARQWELLKQLPARGEGRTSADLTDTLISAGFKVSKRQIERDLWELEERFPIECNMDVRPYLWRWADDASFDLPGLSLAEALSLRLIEETLTPVLPKSIMSVMQARFSRAREYLDNSPQLKLSRWVDKVQTIHPNLPMQVPEVDAEVLETVQAALIGDKQLEVEYQSLKSDEYREMTLNPLGFVQRGSISYLVATVDGYGDVRLFAIHRMRKATALTLTAQRPEGFNLETYIREGALEFGNGQTIQLELRLEGPLGRVLAETPLSADQELKPNGEDHYLTATVIDSWQLHWWLLSQIDHIEVVAPVELRQSIAERLQKGVSKHR